VIRAHERRQVGLALATKRLIDIVGSISVLVLTSPVLVGTAVAIRLDSPGPVLFRQERVGRDGRRFSMLKFRSMRADADDSAHREFLRSLATGGDADVYKVDQDDQITRVGRVIRLLSIDELPQLVNVLRGEMSLVGPRPDVPYALDVYQPRHWQRFDVLPGLTGLWQVSGRSLLSPAQMLDLDVSYAETWTVTGDLRILLRTVPQVLHVDRSG